MIAMYSYGQGCGVGGMINFGCREVVCTGFVLGIGWYAVGAGLGVELDRMGENLNGFAKIFFILSSP